MPVTPVRRLAPVVGDSLFDRLNAQTLHHTDWRRELDEVEREHPDLVIEDGGNLLAAIGTVTATLNYGFANDRAFIECFPRMFEKLLPRVRRVLRAQYLRFRLAHAPSRPFVEPVLKNLAFRPDRDWLEFSLSRSTKLAAAPVPRDVRFREAIADDLPELARIDREAFPDHPMPAELIERRLDEEWTIVAERGGQIAGFCRHTMAAPDAGWISVLAVGAAHRGVGLGAALTTRGAKRLFAEGAREAGLTTDGDNAPAIALYRKLGFRQSASGRDYRRPTDPKAIQKFIQDRRGIHIKFGGWR